MRNTFLHALKLLIVAPAFLSAQTKLPIQQAIEAKYALTKPTADHKDIVTAGAVIDLTKDNLMMFGTDAKTPSTVLYKDGKFKSTGLASSQNMLNRFSKLPGQSGSGSTNRTFVAGEKFWLIGVEVKDDGAVLEFLSDAISDVRYRAFVKYPFPTKGTIPTPDVVMDQIAQTIKAEPTDSKDAAAAPAAAPAAPAAAAAPVAAMAPIPPPPPPTDAPAAAPKTIAVGQTKDEVTTNFGPPTKVVKLATKEIDYYPDMKVTFIKGKVSDVQ